MKKLLLITTFFIIPTISFASIDANLKYGSTGTEVKELQEFLIDKGFLTGQASGNFFSLTRKAVTSYQTSVGLPSTGFVGPMTREKINTELSLADTSSNTAEVKEAGVTTLPTKSDSATAMQKQINDLLAQLQLLNSQVKTQTTVQQQAQQSVQQIQQNTTPVYPPTPNPTLIPQPTPTPSPVITPTAPTPTISLLLPKILGYGRQASWSNGNNYGNVNDDCNNCVALITQMPTTASAYLIEYTSLRGGAALDGFVASNPQNVSIYADNSLSPTHIFLFSHMNMDTTKKYLFIVDATDQNGNKYVQQFGGVDSNSTYLPGPFKWGENQTIKWDGDYPSQYMKSNYYVDVPLTKVQ